MKRAIGLLFVLCLVAFTPHVVNAEEINSIEEIAAPDPIQRDVKVIKFTGVEGKDNLPFPLEKLAPEVRLLLNPAIKAGYTILNVEQVNATLHVQYARKDGDPFIGTIRQNSDCPVNSSGFVEPPPQFAHKKFIKRTLEALTRHRHDGKNDEHNGIRKGQHKAKLERITLGPDDYDESQPTRMSRPTHAWEVVLAKVELKQQN